jgi:CHAT domain-containing protein/Tfp pilus assembly protein PilF
VEVKDSAIVRVQNWADDYDPTELNYAVSFSDNSGFYESEDKFEKYKRSMIGFAVSDGSFEDKLAERVSEMDAEDYNNAGELFYASNRFRSAEKSFKAAILILDREGKTNSETAARAKSNLGLLYHTTGRFTMSEEYTLEALKLRRDVLKDRQGLGASLNNLGVLNKDRGKYNMAEENLAEAISITREVPGENSSEYAIVLNNTAILYQELGKYDAAAEKLKESISIAENGLRKKSANFVRLKVNLALLYQLQGKLDEAEEIFLDAMRIKRGRLGANHPDYAVMLRNIASLYMVKGEYGEVENNLKKALEIYSKKFGETHHAYAATLVDLANYYLFTNRLQEARINLTKAIEIQEQVLGPNHPWLTESRESLAILQWQEGDLKGAAEKYGEVMNSYIDQINTFFPAMSEFDKSRFWEKFYSRFIRYYSFVLAARNEVPQLKGDMFDYHIATKALLLSVTSKVKREILNSSNPELVNKYNEWLDIKEQLSRLYTLSKEELQADKINIDSLENVANSKEKYLSKASELFARGYKIQQVSYKDIAARLENNEACIELVRFPEYNYIKRGDKVYYAGFVVSSDSTKYPEMVFFPDGKEMESSIVLEYRKTMQRGFEGGAFYDAYWGNLEQLTSGKTDLYISPDGIFNQVNMNTLRKENGDYLIDNKNIIYLTNSKDLISYKENKGKMQQGNKEAILMGDPDYDMDFDWDQMKKMPLPELPGTKVEVEKVNDQLVSAGWKTKSWFQQNATEDRIKQISNPAVLHIATHGFFLEDIDPGKGEKVFGIEPVKAAENPLLRSGLMFAGADNTIQSIDTRESSDRNDGVLNAYEAMMLNLDQTQLVILSACETGLGEIRNGEGVYGLQRAFQIAGTSTVVISLWQVSDEVTQKLMTNFYKNWLISGDKQKAFTQAQLFIKEKYPEPFYWGAFVMVSH